MRGIGGRGWGINYVQTLNLFYKKRLSGGYSRDEYPPRPSEHRLDEERCAGPFQISMEALGRGAVLSISGARLHADHTGASD